MRFPVMPVVVLVVGLGSPLLSQSFNTPRFQQGMEAFENAQWELAIQEFEAILQSGVHSEVLYYNLGNAYYRSENIAGTVWAYEKALILNPNDDDSRYNLALANLRVSDRIEPLEVPFILRTYLRIRESLTPGEWVRWISIMLLVVALLHALNYYLDRKIFSRLAGIGLVLVALLTGIAFDSVRTAQRTQEGIIYVSAVTVFSAPTVRSTKLFELHEGIKVSLMEGEDDWYQVELLDGKSGWVHADYLRIL